MADSTFSRYLSILQAPDADTQETREWLEALDQLAAHGGPERARYLLDRLAARARELKLGWLPELVTPYANTIGVREQPPFPGHLELEQRVASILRWNALALVVKANTAHGELGGHIASYASAADLFEVGFNHFFRARTADFGGDLVFFQPHSAPGVYARAYLEGRLSEQQLNLYRQEVTAQRLGVQGLSSYCHPYLMPDFWQFPTGSMGLGPINAIYQARFMRYLSHRSLLLNSEQQSESVLGHSSDISSKTPAERHVWGYFGDGEMDEPESMSALTLAARERLDNLTFVINCNLQRLDGPVRGNGRIIDELESLFAGAGWHVIKLVWGGDWDALFDLDERLDNPDRGALIRALSQTVDGQYQTYAANDGAYNRQHFFGQHPALARMAQGLSDAQIDRLTRGGHDMVKIHAAYAAAIAHKGQPTVILAHTKKGYGMGAAGQGKMTTHQQKKLDRDALIEFRDRFALPLSDEQAADLQFIGPSDAQGQLTAEAKYLRERRAALGGYVPERRTDCDAVTVPPLSAWGEFALKADGKEMSTTMAFVRMMGNLLKDGALGPRVVPIVADEARTFGMANLFKQVGIYSSVGQRYEPEDIGSIMSYRESTSGVILEEGITEAGALASWTAAATSYSTHGLAMLPFYIYYSMFGFQRVGDAIWAAADAQARGFLIGATSGRTTLSGEGLQHQDGSSHLIAGTIPNCKAYDCAFAGELAVVLESGMRAMMQEQRDGWYYLTVMNESYAQPNLPDAAAEGVLRGCYLFSSYKWPKQLDSGRISPENVLKPDRAEPPHPVRAEPPHPVRPELVEGHPPESSSEKHVTLLGSGAILPEVIRAAETLASRGITTHVVSVTSWSELARDGLAHEGSDDLPWIERILNETQGPIVAATDYVRAVPEQIRAYLPPGRDYKTLGTDGFGRSDQRPVLREFFGVDAASVAKAAAEMLG